MRTTKRKPLSLLIWLIVSILVIEAGLQAVYRIRNGHWLARFETFRVEHLVATHDKRQYSLKPGFSDPQRGININPLGFRKTSQHAEPTAEHEVIVHLGDSVPYGYGVRDEESYPAGLARLLQRQAVPLKVVNAGVPSYNFQQSIESFDKQVKAHFQPKIVTLQAANDIGLFLRHRDRWTPEVTWTPHRSELTEYLKRSALFVQVAAPLANLRRARLDHPPTDMLSHVEHITKNFIERSIQSDTAVILMPIDPFYYQTANTDRNVQLARWESWKVASKGWAQLFDQFNEVLIRIVQQYSEPDQVYFFDTRALLDELDRERLYADTIHYSPEGNRIVATGLLHFISERGLIQLRTDASAAHPNLP